MAKCNLLLISIALLTMVGCTETIYVDAEGNPLPGQKRVHSRYAPLKDGPHTNIKISCLDGFSYWHVDGNGSTSTLTPKYTLYQGKADIERCE